MTQMFTELGKIAEEIFMQYESSMIFVYLLNKLSIIKISFSNVGKNISSTLAGVEPAIS